MKQSVVIDSRHMNIQHNSRH